jgi:hypothetical protein
MISRCPDLEPVFPGHSVAQFEQFPALKLDQPLAALTVEMIVLGIAVIVLVDRPPVQFEFPQQPRIHELAQRAIDGGPADISRFAFAGQLLHQRVRVEVVVLTEHAFDQHTTLLRVTHAPTLEILLKPLLGRECDLHAVESGFLDMTSGQQRKTRGGQSNLFRGYPKKLPMPVPQTCSHRYCNSTRWVCNPARSMGGARCGRATSLQTLSSSSRRPTAISILSGVSYVPASIAARI